MSMTTAQARVINPITTTHAQGYKRPGNIGQFLFPSVPVMEYGGKIIRFGKEAFRLYVTKRAPGAHVATVNFGYFGEAFSITPNALQAIIPTELWNDANRVPGIDLLASSVNGVLNSMWLGHEHACATLARDANNYDNDHKLALAGAGLWRAATGKPNDDIETAKEAVRASIGLRANTVALSANAYSACKNNPQILDRLRYTSGGSVTREMLAALWEVENVLVGEAVVATGQDDAFSDVWGDDVIVAYVPPDSAGSIRERGVPSYGYTYTMDKMPMVHSPVYDTDRLSWKQTVSLDHEPVLCGMTAGFLLRGAGAMPAP